EKNELRAADFDAIAVRELFLPRELAVHISTVQAIDICDHHAGITQAQGTMTAGKEMILEDRHPIRCLAANDCFGIAEGDRCPFERTRYRHKPGFHRSAIYP